MIRRASSGANTTGIWYPRGAGRPLPARMALNCAEGCRSRELDPGPCPRGAQEKGGLMLKPVTLSR